MKTTDRPHAKSENPSTQEPSVQHVGAQMKRKYIKHLAAVASILVATLLSGCGGGDEPCSTDSNLFVGFTYRTDGISSSGNVVGYAVGVPFSNTPTVTGVPASCNAGQRFSIAPQASLSGSISIPLGSCSGGSSGRYVNTTNPACASGGTFADAVFDVTLSFPGYSDLKRSVTFVSR